MAMSTPCAGLLVLAVASGALAAAGDQILRHEDAILMQLTKPESAAQTYLGDVKRDFRDKPLPKLPGPPTSRVWARFLAEKQTWCLYDQKSQGELTKFYNNLVTPKKGALPPQPFVDGIKRGQQTVQIYSTSGLAGATLKKPRLVESTGSAGEAGEWVEHVVLPHPECPGMAWLVGFSKAQCSVWLGNADIQLLAGQQGGNDATMTATVQNAKQMVNKCAIPVRVAGEDAECSGIPKGMLTAKKPKKCPSWATSDDKKRDNTLILDFGEDKPIAESRAEAAAISAGEKAFGEVFAPKAIVAAGEGATDFVTDLADYIDDLPIDDMDTLDLDSFQLGEIDVPADAEEALATLALEGLKWAGNTLLKVGMAAASSAFQTYLNNKDAAKKTSTAATLATSLKSRASAGGAGLLYSSWGRGSS